MSVASLGVAPVVAARRAEEAPKPAPRSRFLQKIIDVFTRPLKPDPVDPVGPNRLTHERPFFEVSGAVFGFEVGLTLSQIQQIRRTNGLEIIHVVNPDGSSNLEMVLRRIPFVAGQRIEVQGPALNTSVTPGKLPVGARFLGLALTGDMRPEARDAASYTLEVKITEKSVAELAALAGPGAGKLAAESISGVAQNSVAGVVSHAFAMAVPVVSGLLALGSAKRAYYALKSHRPTSVKVLAVAQAVADAVRVAMPLTGTLISAGLVGIGLWMAKRAAKLRNAGLMPPEQPE